ncbi:hypothetical protein FRB94_006057 [Tulasnella sp. JGI-2019a]|nr:hypothetical protein FRB94_006057 [Tulasnella sp. JGI-2019a]
MSNTDQILDLAYLMILGDEFASRTIQISTGSTIATLQEMLAERYPALQVHGSHIYQYFIPSTRFSDFEEEVKLFKQRGLPPLHPCRRLSNVFETSATEEAIHFIVVPPADQ